MKKEINYGELTQSQTSTVNYSKLILEFIKSLPQVKGKWSSGCLDLEYKYSKWNISFDTFGSKWTWIGIGEIIEYTLYDHTNLEEILKEIYTIIEANKEDIIKTFKVDNSYKIADLKEQIDRLNNELKQLENEQV